MKAQHLRAKADMHRVLHANRLLLGGTSEGAAKGWETRKEGGGGAKAEEPKKKGLLARIKEKGEKFAKWAGLDQPTAWERAEAAKTETGLGRGPSPNAFQEILRRRSAAGHAAMARRRRG